MRRAHGYTWFTTLLFLIFTSDAEATTPQILDVEIEQLKNINNASWLKLTSSSPLSFRVSYLTHPNRIVLDFDKATYHNILQLKSDFHLIDQIRGAQRNNTGYRLVVDSEHSLKLACHTQSVREQHNQLELLIVSAEPASEIKSLVSSTCQQATNFTPPLPTAPAISQTVINNDIKQPQNISTEQPHQWRIQRSDEMLSDVLKRWSHSLGWQLVWESERDFPIEIDTVLTGTFAEALEQVLYALLTSDHPLEAITNEKAKTIRIRRHLKSRGHI